MFTQKRKRNSNKLHSENKQHKSKANTKNQFYWLRPNFPCFYFHNYIHIYNSMESQAQAPPDQDNPQKTKNQFLSTILILCSCIFWVSGYLYSNEHNLPPIQTSMIRGFTIFLLSLGLCWYSGESLDLRRDTKEITVRNVIFLLQAFLMAGIHFYLPLPIIHTLTSTGPIYVSGYQYFLDGKKMTPSQMRGTVIILIGIVLTVNGRLLSYWLLPDYQFTSHFEHYRSQDPKVIIVAALVMLGFMVAWGYAVYVTNRIKASPYQVNTLFGLKLYAISSLLYPFLLLQDGHNIDAPTFYWGFLFSGIAFGIAELCFVSALIMSANIGMTIMLGAFTILVGYVIGLVRYDEELNYFCLAGSAVLVYGLSKILLNQD